jgi:hypothetical protein
MSQYCSKNHPILTEKLCIVLHLKLPKKLLSGWPTSVHVKLPTNRLQKLPTKLATPTPIAVNQSHCFPSANKTKCKEIDQPKPGPSA